MLLTVILCLLCGGTVLLSEILCCVVWRYSSAVSDTVLLVRGCRVGRVEGWVGVRLEINK